MLWCCGWNCAWRVEVGLLVARPFRCSLLFCRVSRPKRGVVAALFPSWRGVCSSGMLYGLALGFSFLCVLCGTWSCSCVRACSVCSTALLLLRGTARRGAARCDAECRKRKSAAGLPFVFSHHPLKIHCLPPSLHEPPPKKQKQNYTKTNNNITGLLAEAKSLGITPDLVAYTAAITACADANQRDKATFLLKEMLSSGIRPDSAAFTALVAALGHAGEWTQAVEILETMPKMGAPRNAVVYNALITSWANAEAAMEDGEGEGEEKGGPLLLGGGSVGAVTAAAAAAAAASSSGERGKKTPPSLGWNYMSAPALSYCIGRDGGRKQTRVGRGGTDIPLFQESALGKGQARAFSRFRITLLTCMRG